MDITAMPKVPNFEQPATLPQKKLIPSQRTSPPKPIGGKDAHIQDCEGAGNTAKVSSSGGDLLDRTPTQNFHRGSILALH